MNNTTDILKRFVELAPPEWGGLFIEEDVPPSPRVCLAGLSIIPPTICLTDDRASAEAIIFLWDWLQAPQSHCDWLCRHGYFRLTIQDGEKVLEATAPTRIHALVLATLAVLEAKVAA